MRVLLITLVMVAFPSWEARGAESTLDPAQPYTAGKSKGTTFDLEMVIAVTAPYHTKTLKVWLPVPPSDAVQQVESLAIETFPQTVKPAIAAEAVHGNRFAFFAFEHPEGAQVIRHRLRVTTHELNWHVDAKKVTLPARWPESFTPYLKGDQAVVIDSTVQKQLASIVPQPKNAAHDLAQVMRWASDTLKYDHGKASLAASSLHALESGGGHCSDYHGLCSAFGRALGYPTRVTYGLNLFPKNSPSHCKLEAFLPPYGWVSYDVSETQRLVNAIGKDPKLTDQERASLQEAAYARLQRGFRDNTWLLQTRGTGYDLAPPAAQKVNVVRTIYAEADGVALPEPDPADAKQKTFAWQVGMKIETKTPPKYPFSYPQ